MEDAAGGVVCVRAVERDHQRPLIVRVLLRSAVQVVSAPAVVGLVGVDSADDQHRAARRVRPDHDRDVVLLALRRAGRCPEQQQVTAGRPALGLEGRRRRPVDRGDHPVLGQDRLRLRLAGISGEVQISFAPAPPYQPIRKAGRRSTPCSFLPMSPGRQSPEPVRIRRPPVSVQPSCVRSQVALHGRHTTAYARLGRRPSADFGGALGWETGAARCQEDEAFTALANLRRELPAQARTSTARSHCLLCWGCRRSCRCSWRSTRAHHRAYE